MTRSAETRLDGTTLVVRIPMRFQRRGGRSAPWRPMAAMMLAWSTDDGIPGQCHLS
jgi:hypothetical protein